MSTIHFLNVGKGDCTLIQHNSGRKSLIDICKGNYTAPKKSIAEIINEGIEDAAEERVRGNFGMSRKPTNPIDYLNALGVDSIFRFILTHPDMDHLDGLDRLFNVFNVHHFWDAGIKKAKPDFSGFGGYEEADWDRYVSAVAGEEASTKALSNLAGAVFQFANRGEADGTAGDGLSILAPDKALVAEANESGDPNDSSYVLLYRVAGHKILIPGDAHDDTWDHVLKNYKEDVKDCSILFAPHHGRSSGADFSFLDVVNPKLTFFGCADSGHLAYSEWSDRGLQVVTNNQAGNIVLDCGENISVYVQNERFAKASGCDTSVKNGQGYCLFGTIYKPAIAET